MAQHIGEIGKFILARSPIPAPVAATLADTFGPPLFQNIGLNADQRFDWLTTHKLDAASAGALCRYEFSPEQLTAILDAEKRRGPVRALAELNGDTVSLRAILSHRNGAVVAEKGVGHDHLDQQPLLELYDQLPEPAKVELLLACTHAEIGDAEVAARLAAIDTSKMSRAVSAEARERVTSLVAYRPALTGHLRKLGFPLLTRTAVAASPWITAEDLELLFERPTTKRLDRTLVRNRWVGLDGPVTQVRCTVARYELENRLRVQFPPTLTCAPWELEGDDLEHVYRWAMPNASQKPGLPQIQMLLMWHPNLGEFAGPLARRTQYGNYWTPRWVERATLTEFAKNHPEHATVQVDLPDPGRSYTYPADRGVGPEHTKYTLATYRNGHLSQLPQLTRSRVDAALGHFAADLGESVEAWTSAVILADGMKGTLAELAAVASAAA